MRVYSEGSEPLTGGSYKLLYAGPSSPRTRPGGTSRTSRAEFVNVSTWGDNYAYGGESRRRPFVRIGGVDGKLYGINQTSGFQEDALDHCGGNVTLHTAFTLDQGAHIDAHTGKMVALTPAVAPPTTCLRQNARRRPTSGTTSASRWTTCPSRRRSRCPATRTRRSATATATASRSRAGPSRWPVSKLEIGRALTAADHGLPWVCSNFTKSKALGSGERAHDERLPLGDARRSPEALTPRAPTSCA